MRGTYKAFLCFLLPILAFAAAAPDPARAQQQEKRVALVVGNGAYAKSPLATTANDAGLIAQTLQAAGFDVVGARDLDGDTLRKSLRDFIQKAQASGPGTVAMIYLAGYGVQLAGENYFIPVDSNITRDTDIPTEGLRISDYARQLASIPLKANIVVLDAARAQPFIEGGQPIASGLALVEPDPNMLIAFNAAPGTVAPEEPGPYGIYAQSLAEMIRTGGLPLAEVFDRVRLRVNEASKGAQVPWNEAKISAPFSFFERGPDAPPPEAAPDQVAAIRNKPIRDLGVQDAYAAALERDTLPAYEEFLAAYPGDPLSKRVMAIVAARREAITWRRTYRNDTPEAYWSYLRRYPRGPHAADARRRLAILTAPPEPPPTFAMIDYDVPPPPPEEVVYVDRPVLYFSDPDFGFAPPPPPPVYYLPPPPPDFVVLEPPLPVVGLFVLPQPLFVPIPVFVRPPIYVAPPPNNIVFNNIHNTTVINTVINRPPAPPVGAGGGAGPGNLRPAIADRANPVAPMLPQAATQRAALIQQGKAPMPLSATVQPTARPGTPPGTPANVAPTGTPPAAPPPKLPQTNTLPVPGAQGGPPAPPAGAGTPQGGRPLAPTANAPGAPPPTHPGAPTTASPGTTLPPHPGAPTAGTPTTVAPTANPAAPGQPLKPPVAQTPPGGGKSATREPAGASPPGTPPGTPSGAAGKPVTPPPSAAREPVKPQNSPATPPAQAARPSPSAPTSRPQAVARPTPPPPAARLAPPPHVASPPPARAAPPVAVARPAPPPMARPAPPPPVARPAPPPPRMAVAPPPPQRPAAPPPHPAAPAAKKCPPNQPKC
ncbi:putative caspase-like protein [Bradyrhizobium japonicum USDA 38]|uniref:caspase family protein n=1 Tax=Bradyrhizobium japonicum TaxID=375 RepID=UPI000422904B|nr:caspase domain-containing protein [Bradyrhizobium japonicum]MCS3895763.1 putative caspase-like protein [Bradyrhizobium japonicum USDA 38]MCS3948278.1 putative caspase-like protein [Bradyrhizobium japonicum]